MSAHRLKLYALASAGMIFLAACGGGSGYGGGGGMGGGAPPAATPGYAATNLVSDVGTASGLYGNANSDARLVNAWGVAFNPNGFVWVTNNGTSTSTLYDGNGVPQSLIVSIAPGAAGSARPTGIVFNGHQDFTVTQNGMSGPSAFVFVGQAGTLSGWSPVVDMTHAVTVFDGAAAGTVYTGLAIASQGTSDFLYAADFHNAAVDMFDSGFAKIAAAGGFADPAMPPGYAPYGVQAIGSLVYVSYAQQDAQASNPVAGAGRGALDAFDTAGHLVRRLVAPGGPLDAPWGMAMAPGNFGTFSGALLVANSGNGTISALNPATGALMGTLSSPSGPAIAIDGLRGIAFGNGLNSQPTNTLFFAAGPGGGAHGVYGRIDVR